MVDLIEYGFKQIRNTANWIEYEGHGFRITVFDYVSKMFNGSEIKVKTFVVDTAQTTSAQMQLTQLQQWLNDKGVNKIA